MYTLSYIITRVHTTIDPIRHVNRQSLVLRNIRVLKDIHVGPLNLNMNPPHYYVFLLYVLVPRLGKKSQIHVLESL